MDNNRVRWAVAGVLIIVVSLVIAWSFYLFAGVALESWGLTRWGDAEGLVLPTWGVFVSLVSIGFVCLWVIVRRRA